MWWGTGELELRWHSHCGHSWQRFCYLPHGTYTLDLGGDISWHHWGENTHTASLKRVWRPDVKVAFIASAHMPLANTRLVNLMAPPKSLWEGKATSWHCRIETQIIERLVKNCSQKWAWPGPPTVLTRIDQNEDLIDSVYKVCLKYPKGNVKPYQSWKSFMETALLQKSLISWKASFNK